MGFHHRLDVFFNNVAIILGNGLGPKDANLRQFIIRNICNVLVFIKRITLVAQTVKRWACACALEVTGSNAAIGISYVTSFSLRF